MSTANASIDDLVARFIEIGVKQDEALLEDRTAEFNRLYKQKSAIIAELRAREGDQRRALIPLYNHPNMQVRLNAATATLATAPEAARQVLEDIQASKMPPQALHAGMTIFNLDEGIFKPA